MNSASIGVNLLWLVPGVVGGSEEYTTRLLLGVAERLPDDLSLTLYVTRAFETAHPEIVSSFPTVRSPVDGRSRLIRVAAESSWLAWRARRDGIELLHHGGGTIPPVRTTPAMVTVHDVQPLAMPANFGALKRAYLRRRLPASARSALLLITISEHGRSAAVELLRAPADRVDVVPPGFVPASPADADGDPAARYRLDRPFFLFPAITYPHKNHSMLLRAFAQVAAGADVLLVLTGGAAQEEEAVRRQAADLGIGARVRRVGRVPRGDLDWMLQHAVALTFPSRHEGFGLPVLEAMGNGCPVIAADETALPEVVGPAGLLVGADDVDGWARAMSALLEDQALRERLVQAGRVRCARFSWEASADAALAAYRHALELARRA